MIPTQPLAWGARVSPEFRQRLYRLVDELGWTEDHASWLMACMAFETGRTFSPSIRNPGSSAVGLIQFMNATARGLGTTTTRLAGMSAEVQLGWVQRYFEPLAKRIKSLEDLYMAILWPAAIGQPNDEALWRPGSATYAANRGLDANKDRRVTKGEAAAKVRELLYEGLLSHNAWAPPPASRLNPPRPPARSGGFDL